VIDAASQINRGLLALVNALLLQAKAKLGVPMAGMTHTQHAQPILLSHFCLAHAERLGAMSRACKLRQTAPMRALWVLARWPEILSLSIERRSPAIWAFPESPATASMPLATGISRSTIFRADGIATHLRGSRGFLCCLLRRNFPTSFFPTNIPPAAA